jgi:hypothetical protein
MDAKKYAEIRGLIRLAQREIYLADYDMIEEKESAAEIQLSTAIDAATKARTALVMEIREFKEEAAP